MTINSHDDYFDAAPKQFRSMLQDLRAQLARTLQDACEALMYSTPGFQIFRLSLLVMRLYRNSVVCMLIPVR